MHTLKRGVDFTGPTINLALPVKGRFIGHFLWKRRPVMLNDGIEAIEEDLTFSSDSDG